MENRFLGCLVLQYLEDVVRDANPVVEAHVTRIEQRLVLDNLEITVIHVDNYSNPCEYGSYRNPLTQ